MPFPDKKQIKEVLKKLEGVEGSLTLPPNPSIVEKLKWEISQQFIIYKRKQGLTNTEMSEKLSITEQKLEKILHYRVEGIATDELLILLEIITPGYKVIIN